MDHAALSGILDFPRKTLPQDIWDYENKDALPELNRELRALILKEIQNNLEHFDLKLSGCMLYGGSASYQWSPGTDIDVSVYVDWGKSKEDPLEVQEYFKNIEIPFKGHPIHLFVKEPSQSQQVEVSDAVYDIIHDCWVLPPLILPTGFDPDEYFKPVLKIAELKAQEFDIKIGKLRRALSIFKKAKEALKEAENTEIVEQRMKEEGKVIKDLIIDLALSFYQVRERRYKMHDMLREKLIKNHDLGRFERFQEPEIIWKYLDRAGYNDFLWKLYKLNSEGNIEKLLETY